MAQTSAYYAQQYSKGNLIPSIYAHGRVRILSDIITLKSQASGDTILIGPPLPRGTRLIIGMLLASRSLGSATIKIGTQDDPDDYRSAQTLTNTNPSWFALLTDDTTSLTKSQQIILTIGNAAFPNSGTLLVNLLYTTD